MDVTPSGIRVSATISLGADELSYTPYHASGPGGQHVNKVATAIALKFNAEASPSLTGRVKRRLRELAGRRMDQHGVITLQAARYRSQTRNKDDATGRLLELIREAAAPPPKPRRPTRPSKASKERRIGSKKKRGATKSLRGKVRGDD